MVLRLSLFLLSMLTCTVAWAVGFGHAEVKSHLGEPLDISIPLVLSDQERQDNLKVTLATPQAYQMLEQNIPASYLLLRAEARETHDGLSVHVSSFQAIDESFLTIILKVQRGRGNFYKRIQVLLDPAWQKSNQLSHEKTKRNGALPKSSSPIVNTSVQQIGSVVHQQQSLPPISSPLDWARRGSYGPVQSGDNLSEIAYRLRKDKRFSNYQVMLALFHANPQAFEDHDINKLKKGSFIQVPKLQDMDSFLNSIDYQKLKKRLNQKNKALPVTQITAEPLVDKQPARKYSTRISLGMTESLSEVVKSEVMIGNAAVMNRLEKLEPLYDQVMASSLQVDMVGVQVKSLAEEVRLLQQQINQLSQQNTAQVSARQQRVQENDVWWWFLLLLTANILLLLFFVYRKQREIWQDKLEKVQRGNTPATPNLKKKTVVEVTKAAPADHIRAEKTPATNHKTDTSPLQKDLVTQPVHEQVSPATDEETPVDEVTSFEVAIQKKDWQKAEKHYQSIVKHVRNKPRVQALYVQMLHQEQRIVKRNEVLLNLYRSYSSMAWSHFCSFFDEDIWLQLQDERVISFTGEVFEAGLEHSSLAAKELDNLLAFSEMKTQDTMMNKTVMIHTPDFISEGDVETHESKRNAIDEVDEKEDDTLMFKLDVEETSNEKQIATDMLSFTEIDIALTDETEKDSPKSDKP